MSQSEQIGESWAYCRDNLKGESEADAYALAEIRRYKPLDIRKVQMVLAKANAPKVVPARPARDPRASSSRANYNELQKYARMMRPAPVAEPNPPRPPAPVVCPVVSAKASSAPRYDDKARKAKREHMMAMAKMVYSDYNPSEADIIYAFGSIEHWEEEKRHAGL